MSLGLVATGLIAPGLIAPVAEASAPKKKGGGTGYTQFSTLSVFTAARRRRHGTLSVDMGLYSDDPKLVDLILLYQPRLKDAYITRLQAYAIGLGSNSLVDVAYISDQLQKATDAVLPQKGAKVLLGSVLLN
ncbi:MAG: Tat pathway signal protein [Asticcacaulis sp.]